MRFEIKSNGVTRVGVTLHEIMSIITVKEYDILRAMKKGDSYTRDYPACVAFTATRIH